MKRTTQLRQLLERPRTTLLGGVHDGLSSTLAERAGFEGLWASGFCISTSKKMPDVGLVTMAEHLAATREIVASSGIPVVADVDDGFGDVVNVTRMVREYEAAGVAGVCIEDNRHPKRCSLFSEMSRALVSGEEFAAKIRAAKAAQSDPDFIVVARTEAIVADLGVDEALRRGRLYDDAGADLILVHSKDPKPDRVLQFGERWDRDTRLVAVPTKYPSVTDAELLAAGYKMVIFANQGLRASITAMDRVFRGMASARSLLGIENEIAPLSEIFDLVGFDEVQELETRFRSDISSSGDDDPER